MTFDNAASMMRVLNSSHQLPVDVTNKVAQGPVIINSGSCLTTLFMWNSYESLKKSGKSLTITTE